MRIVMYKSTDPGEFDNRYLAARIEKRDIVQMATSQTADGALARLEGRALQPAPTGAEDLV